MSLDKQYKSSFIVRGHVVFEPAGRIASCAKLFLRVLDVSDIGNASILHHELLIRPGFSIGSTIGFRMSVPALANDRSYILFGHLSQGGSKSKELGDWISYLSLIHI